MFEKLSDRLSEALRKLTGRGVITESDIREAMRQVRRALLEADVNFKVAKEFTASVSRKAVGEKVLKSLSPGQQVVSIVHEELVSLLGPESEPLDISGTPPLVYMLVGLQGSGKTTTAARLARWLLDRKGKRSLLVACDLQRPAAIDQLEIVAETAQAGFYGRKDATDPAQVLSEALVEAKKGGYDAVIADTAGRLHVDEPLMDELSRLQKLSGPTETLLVLDGLSGQDALNVAVAFRERIGYTGSVITKMDGDSRGGAALSFRAVTGLPIKFIGTGESVDGLEPLDPERLAGRILGMGDIVGLVEKAQEAWDLDEAEKLEKKLVSNTFNLEDFAGELKRIKKMGSLGDLLSLLPKNMRPSATDMDTSQFGRMEAIIGSMTVKERRHPEIISGSRRKRIALGSGTKVSDVNKLLREFRTMKKMMKRMKAGRGMNLPAAFR